MEFLRFGSSIPGEYWGCCACDIIQNFKQHPDTPASIQITTGDANTPCMQNNERQFAGPTLRDVFEARIRIGTFGNREMPNHAFFAILEASQCVKGSVGWEWLKILKSHAFEFIRAVDNSVYTGPQVPGTTRSPHPNYIFGLFRNISGARIVNPFKPPQSWLDLPSTVPEAYEEVPDTEAWAAEQTAKQREIWGSGKLKLITESAVVKAGAPVLLTGLRTEFPVERAEDRDKKLEARKQTPYKPSSGTQHALYAKQVTPTPIQPAQGQGNVQVS